MATLSNEISKWILGLLPLKSLDTSHKRINLLLFHKSKLKFTKNFTFLFERSRIIWFSELLLAFSQCQSIDNDQFGVESLRFTSQIAPYLNKDLYIHLMKFSLTKNLTNFKGICLFVKSLFLRTPCTVNKYGAWCIK